jgi:hypothetical protein
MVANSLGIVHLWYALRLSTCNLKLCLIIYEGLFAGLATGIGASTPLLGIPLNGTLVYVLQAISEIVIEWNLQRSCHREQPHDRDNYPRLQLDWWVPFFTDR